MATVPGKPHTGTNGVTESNSRAGERRRDWVIVVLMVAGLIAFFIWMASLNGIAPSGDYYDYDLWMSP